MHVVCDVKFIFTVNRFPRKNVIREVKVKISLCLTKYYAMKTCHCLMKYHAINTQGSGGTALCILNLGSR
jgi:hypothetical protein